jgi:hypothetical protein
LARFGDALVAVRDFVGLRGACGERERCEGGSNGGLA